MRRQLTAIAFAALLAVAQTQSGYAMSTAEVVGCSIDNLTPSVQLGTWANYVVHMSGGYGTYSVMLSYGDGLQDGGSYASSTANFNHLFGARGTYTQTATVSGAGSQATCGTSTSVY
ncbi:MAG TPA: hypothetical protein VFC31_14850 [Candidatus Limnocylindria bacterium]|nr:hypothetical protein [Candidatus Limnocylindria bacterium]